MFEKRRSSTNNYLFTALRHPSILSNKTLAPLRRLDPIASSDFEKGSPESPLLINKEPINLNFHEDDEDNSLYLNLREMTSSDLFDNNKMRKSFHF